MTDLVDAARERMAHAILATWEAQEFTSGALMRKIADALNEEPRLARNQSKQAALSLANAPTPAPRRQAR
jgi:hypothetical protein